MISLTHSTATSRKGHTVDYQQTEIADGMLRWESGTLASQTLDRLLQDVLADIWTDTYRRDILPFERRREFFRRVHKIMFAATGLDVR